MMVGINTVQRVHRVGYRLKEAKTTLNEDVRISVADIRIAGARGEVLNVPQWVGKVLTDSNLAILDEPDMVTELKQALSKEKMAGENQLSTLDPHFYVKLKEAMRGLERDDYDAVEGMMVDLFRMRRGKLIKTADSVKMSSDLYKKLTVEEAVFYKSIRDTSAEFEKQIRGERG